MLDALSTFFSTEQFMPHGHCYLWTPGLVWLQVITNSLIGLAYVAIAITLVVLVKRGRTVPFKGMALAFGVFIVTCGMTHFFDVFVIWKPSYWADGAVRAVTAVASVATALLLPPLVPKALAVAKGAQAAREKGIELESAVEELGQMYEKATELDELKTQFFANVSHELRTPLTLILGPVEGLLGAENLTADQRRDVDVVLRNGQVLLKHVNDLLDVARLEAQEVRPAYRSADLGRLVRRVAGSFESAARDDGLRFALDAPEELPAEFDVDKVQRVILNLVANAFKFTPAGGEVLVRVGEAGEDRVFLEVADSGPGVPPAQRQAVFERFRQVDGSATRRFGGTGLGLAIAKEFVELHQGSIEIRDSDTKGALFRVELPRSAPKDARVERAEPKGPAAPAAAPLDATARALASSKAAGREESAPRVSPSPEPDAPTVLVVEDEPEMNRFVCDLLRPWRAVSAADGREALKRLEHLTPDLVVTDLMMPQMSGDQLVQAIRKRPALDAVPVLVATARADNETRINLLQAGAQDFVLKPFVPAELRARAGNLIEVKRVREVLQSELERKSGDLASLAEELAGRKRELSLALEEAQVARTQAEQASLLKTDFLRLVSHELRTPLATLQLQLERARVEGVADPEAVLARLRQQTDRLHRLVEDALRYAKAEAGSLPVESQEVIAREVVDKVLAELGPRAKERGLALVPEVDEGMSLVTDPTLLRLVLVNLADNAVKYTDQGSVTIRATEREGRPAFSVVDSGQGIDPADLGRIFDPFVQSGETRKKHAPGAGLGLSLVREIVDSLGGEIFVDSTPGTGSTFLVSLPAANPGA